MTYFYKLSSLSTLFQLFFFYSQFVPKDLLVWSVLFIELNLSQQRTKCILCACLCYRVVLSRLWSDGFAFFPRPWLFLQPLMTAVLCLFPDLNRDTRRSVMLLHFTFTLALNVFSILVIYVKDSVETSFFAWPFSWKWKYTEWKKISKMYIQHS